MTIHSIDVRGLRKSYRGTVVLDDVDLQVPAGTVTALLGPNGAGKTTTVHILTTLVRADSGTAVVAGCDVRRDPQGVRAAIGLTGQFSAVDGLLSGEENLLLMARLRHLGAARSRSRVAELLEQFDLVDAARAPLATYSGGMRRRLDLAMTLVTTPSVIFLDEPTTGLDPRSRHTMWQIVRELVADGTTVLLTTQYLDEADELADRIAVLDGGRIVADGTPDELKRLVPGGHLRLRFADAAGLDEAARLLPGSSRDEVALVLTVPTGPDATGTGRSGSPGSSSPTSGSSGLGPLRAVLDRLDAAHLEVDDLSIHTPDLDDVFFALTGGPTRAPSPAATVTTTTDTATAPEGQAS
jgi:ABC-2 type transport system ATP-binding protein